MGINKLALTNFYETNKQDYIARRGKGNNPTWDEAYKWKYLPEANQALATYESVDKANVQDVIEILDKHKANFAHWIEMDDLSMVVDRSNGYQILREVWDTQLGSVGTAIDDANSISSLLLDKKFSPSTFGYILAAKDCDQYIIYRDTLYRAIAKLCQIDRPSRLTPGQKYKFLNDAAIYIGELMKQDKSDYQDFDWYQALNGQDFLYVTIQYPVDAR